MFVLAAVAALALAAPAASQAARPKHEVKVMTRNLYLGADLNPVIASPGDSGPGQACCDGVHPDVGGVVEGSRAHEVEHRALRCVVRQVPGPARTPATEAVTTMAPPPASRRARAAALMPSIGPRRLTAKIRSAAATTRGPPTAACRRSRR